jgi:nicotinamide mononucleotide adenylyltransferase
MTRTRGFLLGKFMPPHEGHLLLCDVVEFEIKNLTWQQRLDNGRQYQQTVLLK